MSFDLRNAPEAKTQSEPTLPPSLQGRNLYVYHDKKGWRIEWAGIGPRLERNPSGWRYRFPSVHWDWWEILVQVDMRYKHVYMFYNSYFGGYHILGAEYGKIAGELFVPNYSDAVALFNPAPAPPPEAPPPPNDFPAIVHSYYNVKWQNNQWVFGISAFRTSTVIASGIIAAGWIVMLKPIDSWYAIYHPIMKIWGLLREKDSVYHPEWQRKTYAEIKKLVNAMNTPPVINTSFIDVIYKNNTFYLTRPAWARDEESKQQVCLAMRNHDALSPTRLWWLYQTHTNEIEFEGEQMSSKWYIMWMPDEYPFVLPGTFRAVHGWDEEKFVDDKHNLDDIIYEIEVIDKVRDAGDDDDTPVTPEELDESDQLWTIYQEQSKDFIAMQQAKLDEIQEYWEEELDKAKQELSEAYTIKAKAVIDDDMANEMQFVKQKASLVSQLAFCGVANKKNEILTRISQQHRKDVRTRIFYQ